MNASGPYTPSLFRGRTPATAAGKEARELPSIRSTSPHGEKRKLPRFRRLDIAHISAIESLYKQFPFLQQRMEIHMPSSRAKAAFAKSALWMWPKFDKRPAGYLIFMEGFAPCIWYPDSHEGLTFRWLLPPSFSQKGPTICLANILAGESLLQVEDLLVDKGVDRWSRDVFSERWEHLRAFWATLPPDQPLLAFTPKMVTPMSIEQWEEHYDPSLYWTIQPDHAQQPRWFWKDVATVPSHPTQRFIEPKMKRGTELITQLTARCVPYTKMALPDTYTLLSQEGQNLGFASITTIHMSHELRNQFANKELAEKGLPVEVRWNPSFRKYQLIRIQPEETPITTATFFHHLHTTPDVR